MRLIACFCLALCAVGATAQMPLPPFGSTFSSPTLTRGFYFQAPVAFTITGLRVPDESNHGLQNVAVYKPSAKPPTWPTTATGGLQFYKGGVASSQIISTAVSFNQGDWVGILGACGDANTMRNSYGAGNFQSMILGQPVTINRFITQTNIVTNQGNAPWAENGTGSIGRVEVYVNGVALQGAGTGAPGTGMNFGLSAPLDAGLAYQMASSLGNGPTPIGPRTLGLSLDTVFGASVSQTLPAVFVNYVGQVGASGGAAATLNIPPFAFLKGITIHSAFVTFDQQAPLGIKNISNTFTFMIT